MYRVVTPQTAAELDAYYQLRWELLRKPFNLPLGSERDEYDTVAIHRLMLAPDGTPIAVGRLFVGGDEAQIRFMALRPEYRGQGLGARMVEDLRATGPEREGQTTGDERPSGGGGVLPQVRLSRGG